VYKYYTNTYYTLYLNIIFVPLINNWGKKAICKKTIAFLNFTEIKISIKNFAEKIIIIKINDHIILFIIYNQIVCLSHVYKLN